MIRRGLLCSVSIAAVASLTMAPAVLAQSTAESRVVTLPSLGNTADTDREMLGEVGDEVLYTPEQTATRDSALALSDEAPPSTSDGGLEPDGSAEQDHATSTIDDAAETQPETDPWARIRQSDRLTIADNEEIANYRESYIKEAMWIGRIFERSRPYISHLVDELDARFLPVELALLPAVESGYRPNVTSTGKAVGLWQIVPITAEEIGIERGPWFDGRADIERSTTAAIDYLSFLNAEFHGDWELTLAAYNAGPGRVRRAMRKNRESNKPTDFWSLTLPDETHSYVPKMLALVALIKEMDSPIPLPELTDDDGFEKIDVGVRISVDKAAKIAEINEETLTLLNAGLVHGVTPPSGPHTLYLPKGKALRLSRALASANPAQLFSLPKTHEVVSGDTLSAIAERYGMTQRQVMELNAMGGTVVRIGQRLTVRDTRAGSVGKIEYVVAIGDTLSEIARRHSVQIRDILDAEGGELSSDVIHPGETLTIVVSLGNQG